MSCHFLNTSRGDRSLFSGMGPVLCLLGIRTNRFWPSNTESPWLPEEPCCPLDAHPMSSHGKQSSAEPPRPSRATTQHRGQCGLGLGHSQWMSLVRRPWPCLVAPPQTCVCTGAPPAPGWVSEEQSSSSHMKAAASKTRKYSCLASSQRGNGQTSRAG